MKKIEQMSVGEMCRRYDAISIESFVLGDAKKNKGKKQKLDNEKKELFEKIANSPLTSQNLQSVIEFHSDVKLGGTGGLVNEYFRRSTEPATKYYSNYRDKIYKIVTDKDHANAIVTDPNSFMSNMPPLPRELVEIIRPMVGYYGSRSEGMNAAEKDAYLLFNATKQVFMLISSGALSSQITKEAGNESGTKIINYLNQYQKFLQSSVVKAGGMSAITWNNFNTFLGDQQKEGVVRPNEEAFNGFRIMIENFHHQLVESSTLTEIESVDTESLMSVSSSPEVSPRTEEVEPVLNRENSQSRIQLGAHRIGSTENIQSSVTRANTSSSTLQRSESQEKLRSDESDPKKTTRPNLLKKISSNIENLLRSKNSREVPNAAKSMLRDSELLMQGTLTSLPIALSSLGNSVRESHKNDVASAFKEVSSYFQQSVRLYCQAGSVGKVDENLGTDNAQYAKNNLENGVRKMTELLAENPHLISNNKGMEGIIVAVNKAASEGLIPPETVKQFNAVVTEAEDKASLKK